jgi:uncharacterized protein (TIGR00288 family)
VKDFTSGRPTRIALHEPPAHAPNAALMIDFDNVTMGIRSDLQNQLRKLLNSEIIKGKVAVQRAYADWRRYPQYIVPLSEASIDLIFAPAFGSNKKNATDIRLAIDALELVFTRPEIGTFILLSGDSDFSSLVLKLKEYGKYIIGVGLRESSSDLLIQNCDEYYSYTELTGLTREGDAVSTSRDPWELVVEAVTEMRRESDVMRSDRLKQVMQSLDPNFDEKDAGFSRFSKFVVEAGQRGLLTIEKMENGQYAVDVGENANVPPEEEAELRKARPKEQPTKPRRRRSRRKEEDESEDLTLSAAFDLLRRVLAELEQTPDGVPAEDVLARMAQLHGGEDDPLFQERRFQRMLRQAHDANVIELAKVGGSYRLKPVPPADTADEGQSAKDEAASRTAERQEQAPKDAGDGGSDAAADSSRSKRSGSRRSPRARSRSGRRKADEKSSEEPKHDENRTKNAADSTTPAPSAQRTGNAAAGTATGTAGRKRNPRYRRGSRGTTASNPAATAETQPGKAGSSGATAEARPTASSPPSREVEGARSVGLRRGGRSHSAPPPPSAGASGTADRAKPDPSTPPPAGESRTAARPEPASPSSQSVEQPVNAEDTASAGPASPQGSLFDAQSQEEGSLFRRMTAALQRVVRGPESE